VPYPFADASMRLKKPWLFKGLISWRAQNMNADKFNQIPRLLYAMLAIFMAAFIAAPVCAQNAFNHIVVVIEENHNYNQVIGNASMPYFNSLANNYGVATQYYANTHPSIGNYFMLTTGQILTNDDTKTPSNSPSRRIILYVI
jgi:hypothetical protein